MSRFIMFTQSIQLHIDPLRLCYCCAGMGWTIGSPRVWQPQKWSIVMDSAGLDKYWTQTCATNQKLYTGPTCNTHAFTINLCHSD